MGIHVSFRGCMFWYIVMSVPAFVVPRLVFLAIDWRLVPLGVMLVYVGSCIQG